jgi:ribosomal protein S16
LRIAHDRVEFWVSKGAQASDAVQKLLKRSAKAQAAGVTAA